MSSGDLPFFARPTLGGSHVLRGYIAGRWRDDAAWAAATEYRVWVLPRGFTVWRHIHIERVGLALFYEVGGVAKNGLEFFQERVRHSYGIGGRFTLERGAIFRADFGFSEDGLNVAAGFGLPFRSGHLSDRHRMPTISSAVIHQTLFVFAEYLRQNPAKPLKIRAARDEHAAPMTALLAWALQL